MISAYSTRFKKRMFQLTIAVRDLETNEVVTGHFGEIHSRVLDRLNRKRNLRDKQDIPFWTMCDMGGRGYVKKDTGEFITADEASKWACEGADPYDSMNRWCGESISLRDRKTAMSKEEVKLQTI